VSASAGAAGAVSPSPSSASRFLCRRIARYHAPEADDVISGSLIGNETVEDEDEGGRQAKRRTRRRTKRTRRRTRKKNAGHVCRDDGPSGDREWRQRCAYPVCSYSPQSSRFAPLPTYGSHPHPCATCGCEADGCSVQRLFSILGAQATMAKVQGLVASATQVEEVVNVTRALVDIESVSGNEKAVADYLASLLESEGYTVERQILEEGKRENLLAYRPNHRLTRLVINRCGGMPTPGPTSGIRPNPGRCGATVTAPPQPHRHRPAVLRIL